MTVNNIKHIVCYSGGHSSALVALNVAERFGNKDILLVNHDISPNVEHEDIKRFKQQVADYIGIPITFVNSKHLPKDQFDVCIDAKAFKVGNGFTTGLILMKKQGYKEGAVS